MLKCAAAIEYGLGHHFIYLGIPKMNMYIKVRQTLHWPAPPLLKSAAVLL